MYTPHAHVLLSELADHTGVLLDLDTKFYFTLNASAVLVWKALAEGAAQSPSALAERVSAVFRVDPAAAEADVRVLLEGLVAEGLVAETER